MCRAPAALLVLAACATAERGHDLSTPPEVVESFELDPYVVSGSTITQLRAAMRALRPAAGDGKRFDAMTHWQISYKYYFSADPQTGCGAADPQVHLELQMEFPTLGGEVPPQSRIALESYLTALRVHEDGHVKIDREVAVAVAAAVRKTPPQPTCEKLRAAVREAANREMEAGRDRNEAYDAQTRHGSTQGANFPR